MADYSAIDRKRKETGKNGEDLVEFFLIEKGFSILERNLKLYAGEIDILAKKDKVIVIVEVKTVSGDNFGPAIGYVNVKKQNKLRQLAKILLQKYGEKIPIRIDVAGVSSRTGKIDYIENAVEDI